MADTAGPRRGKNSFKRSVDDLYIEEGFNLRPPWTDEEIEEMLQSIIGNEKDGGNGIVTNLKVTLNKSTGKYKVIEGHRRTLAVRKGISDGRLPATFLLPCESLDESSDKAQNYMQLLANGRNPVPPMGLAIGYSRALKYGETKEDIQRTLGCSMQHINDTLLLLNANASLQDEIKQGNVSATLVSKRLKKQSSTTIENDIAAARAATGKTKITEKHLPAISKVKQTDLTKEVSKYDQFRTWLKNEGYNEVLEKFNTIFKK